MENSAAYIKPEAVERIAEWAKPKCRVTLEHGVLRVMNARTVTLEHGVLRFG